MVFSLFQEQQLISSGDKIPIQVDFTSNKDHFLILSASIIVGNRAVPIYFTMRNYPKRKASYDHKKMELAFLKGLKHALSKRFSYIIIADRGFGNARFTQACQKAGLDYIVRIEPNMRAESRGQKGVLGDLFKKDTVQAFHLGPWDGEVHVCRHTHEDKRWYLVSNIKDMSSNEYVRHYRNRFKIEKCFQDLKSSGFDLESSKISKYDRYKRHACNMCSCSYIVSCCWLYSTSEDAFVFKKLTVLRKCTLSLFSIGKYAIRYSKPSTIKAIIRRMAPT